MRIIIINESIIAGGAEIQAAREKRLFTEKGHEVALLTFDPAFPINLKANTDNSYNIPIKFSNIQKVYHRLFRSKYYTQLIRSVFEDFKPEYIHINHTKHLPLDVFNIVKDYPCVQTLRDYSFVCPKETCIKDDGSICLGYKHGHCLTCLGKHVDGYFKFLNINRINRKRLAAVNVRVAPSQALADACTLNELETQCLNNPFDFSILKQSQPKTSQMIYLYYGKVSEEKGVLQLLDAFDEFVKYYPEAELWIIGRLPDRFKDTFTDRINGKKYIKYKGVMENERIMDIYKDIYCVVVPSLWIENYPNTVLEAIANKTMVIGTNRGGIPELIANEHLLFDIKSHDDFLDKLKYTAILSKNEYCRIVNERFNYIIENNSLETYYNRLCAIYGRITSTNNL